MRKICFKIILAGVAFLLFSFNVTKAFDMFDVHAPAIGENLAGGSPRNTANWPSEIVQAIKADQAEAVEKMEKSGYENWDIVRSVSGKVLSVEIKKGFFGRLWDALTSFVRRIFGLAANRFNFEGTDVILGPRHCPPPKFERDPITGKKSEVRIFGILVDLENEQKVKADITMAFTWDFLAQGWNCTPGNPEGTVGPELSSVPQTIIPDTARDVSRPVTLKSLKKIEVDFKGTNVEANGKTKEQLKAKGADDETVGRFLSIWGWLEDLAKDVLGDDGPSSYPSSELSAMVGPLLKTLVFYNGDPKNLSRGGTEGTCMGVADAAGIKALTNMQVSEKVGAFFDTMNRIGNYLKGVLDSPNAGKEILETLADDFLKSKIKEAVGFEKDEVVVQARSTPCEETATLRWDKKNSKLSFTVDGNCSCKEAATKWYHGSNDRLKVADYSLIMTADLEVELTEEREKFRFNVTNIKREANANCDACKPAEQLKILPSFQPIPRDEDKKSACEPSAFYACIDSGGPGGKYGDCNPTTCIEKCPFIPVACPPGTESSITTEGDTIITDEVSCADRDSACIDQCWVKTRACENDCFSATNCARDQIPPRF